MNGIEFFRRSRGMSTRELAEKSDLSLPYLRGLIRGKEHDTALNIYVRLSDALGVRVDDLLMNFDESELDVGTYNSYEYRTENPDNCIASYRSEKGLSYRELALRMGLTSREAGRIACKHTVPREKHLRALAAYEGISPEEFCRRYSAEDEIGGSL